jgi:hypothetical protein
MKHFYGMLLMVVAVVYAIVAGGDDSKVTNFERKVAGGFALVIFSLGIVIISREDNK